MHLADDAVDTGAHISLNLEERQKLAQIHKLGLARKIVRVVPFNHGVLELAHPISITEDLEHTILDFAHLAIVAVREDCVCRWPREHRREPFKRVDVYEALHVVQVYGDLDCVTLINLVYWLQVRSVD